MNRVGVTTVSITSCSMSVNDRPNCSQYQAMPPGPAGCPDPGSWSVKSALNLSSNGNDASWIFANASRVACPPSAISVAISVLLSGVAADSHLLSTPPQTWLHLPRRGRRADGPYVPANLRET